MDTTPPLLTWKPASVGLAGLGFQSEYDNCPIAIEYLPNGCWRATMYERDGRWVRVLYQSLPFMNLDDAKADVEDVVRLHEQQRAEGTDPA